MDEMSDENLSLEDTNRIRSSLGLKPIPQQEPASQSKEDLSLQETNRLRISLGLKPIPEALAASRTPDISTENKSEIAGGQDTKQTANQNKSKEAKLKTFRRKLIPFEAAEEEDSESTDDWLFKVGKPLLASTSETVSAFGKDTEYTQDDLNGLKIGHNLSELRNLKENEILTLKDGSVLDASDDDELVNENLVSEKKLKKKLRDQKLENTPRPYAYDGENGSIDEIADAEGGTLISGGIQISSSIEPEVEKDDTNRKKVQINLFDESDEVENDSHDYQKIKIRKPKKIRESKKRQRPVDDEDKLNKLQKTEVVDYDGGDLIDDEELQLALARKRRAKQNKRTFLKPEELAREIEEHEMENQDNEGDIIINDATEFLDSISVKFFEKKEKGKEHTKKVTKKVVKQVGETVSTVEAGESYIADKDKEITSLREEPNFKGGLAETLRFLQSRNLVVSNETKQKQVAQQIQEIKETKLETLNFEIEERLLKESIMNDPQYKNLTLKERQEYLNNLMNEKMRQRNGNISKRLENYNPQVKLRYIDENGTELSTKEAYKNLSHQFHGTGPGKSKQEKKLKKIQETINSNRSKRVIGVDEESTSNSNANKKIGYRLQ